MWKAETSKPYCKTQWEDHSQVGERASNEGSENGWIQHGQQLQESKQWLKQAGLWWDFPGFFAVAPLWMGPWRTSFRRLVLPIPWQEDPASFKNLGQATTSISLVVHVSNNEKEPILIYFTTFLKNDAVRTILEPFEFLTSIYHLYEAFHILWMLINIKLINPKTIFDPDYFLDSFWGVRVLVGKWSGLRGLALQSGHWRSLGWTGGPTDAVLGGKPGRETIGCGKLMTKV